MNKPSVRKTILLRSVQQLLGPDEQVNDVVVMFTRHRWFLPYSLFAGVALFLVAAATGVESVGSQVLFGLCGLAIAGLATTNYWVLADTTDGLALCRSSRVRQYAKELVRRFPDGTDLEMVGSTVVTSDWKIDGVMYTLTKRWEATMRALAST